MKTLRKYTLYCDFDPSVGMPAKVERNSLSSISEFISFNRPAVFDLYIGEDKVLEGDLLSDKKHYETRSFFGFRMKGCKIIKH
jgi:hypothetical protein